MSRELLRQHLLAGAFGTVFLVAAAASAQPVLRVDDDAPPGGDGQAWSSAFRYLQDALIAAGPGSGVTEIRVAQGLYLPDHDEAGGVAPGNRHETFGLLDGVSVRGGYAGLSGPDPDQRDVDAFITVLSGDLLQDDIPYFVNVDDNSFHVVTARGTNATAVLDGFTVSGGNTDGLSGVEYPEYRENGSAVFCWDGSPTLINCTLRHCRAVRGGAVYANGETWYNGELMYIPIAPTFIDCYFTENYSLMYGGAVALNVSGLTMSGCTFFWNETTGAAGGGALSLLDPAADGAGATIHNSQFLGNYSSNGLAGAVRIRYVPTEMVNTLLAGNTATADGGAMYVDPLNSVINIDNCTVAGNTSFTGNGGGLRVTGYNVSIRNSILWGNAHGGPLSPELYGQLCGPGETIVHASCMQDWSGQYAGEHNIALDPGFVDPLADDFRLSPGSPCIDAADNAVLPPGITTDLDGNPRFVDDPDTPDTGLGDPPIVDMGAYEFQLAPPCPADVNADGVVDVLDLLAVLAAWGATGGPEDVNGDGIVDVLDLLDLLASWGPC